MRAKLTRLSYTLAKAQLTPLSAILAFAGCTVTLTPAGDDTQANNTTGGGKGNPPLKCTAEDGISTPMRRLTANQYTNSVRDIFNGVVAASDSFPRATTGISQSGFSTDPDLNAVTQEGAMNIMEAAEDTAVAVAEKLPQLLPCYPKKADEACATTFITEYGKRAYRRPLTSDERTGLLGVYRTLAPTSFETGISAVVATLLQAPQFLYRVEQGSRSASGAKTDLTSYEVATRLSYLLWDTTPDSALLDAAEKGQLNTSEGLRSQADRLLSDGRAGTAIIRFYREWANFKTYTANQKDQKLYPEYDAQLADSMQEQFDRFVFTSTVAPTATLQLLLTRKDVPVNERLARFYGVPYTDPNPSAFRSALLPADQTSGLLTLPALLSGLSHPAATSITIRGKLVRKKLLCTPMENPPADAAQRLPAMPPGATPRQKAEIMGKTPGCGHCHSQLDPIGLGFERFDAIGKYRATGPDGNPIDDSGSIAGGLSTGSQFTGVADLGQHLADSEEVKSCLVKQWFRFTYSRIEQETDACTLQAMKDSFNASGFRMRELVLSVVAPPSFRIRALGGQP